MRVTRKFLVLTLAPLSAAASQVSSGIGPVGQLSSAASTWRTSASLWGMARFEHPFASSAMTGQFTSVGGGFRFGSLTGRQQLFSPSIGGLRAVTSLDFESRSTIEPGPPSALSATSSLSYRRGLGGLWVGNRIEKSHAAALRAGGWRQIGQWLTLAVSSSLRRATVGATPARYWTETFQDSIWSDSGWIPRIQERVYGDSGSAGRRRSWLETEARAGWARGRFALDGVVGWRPTVDSTTVGSTWVRAITTVAVSKNVALSAGIGTTLERSPVARPTGRYATVALRLAPAALVRPRETPEITPTAASFRLEPSGDQFVVRVRLPQARIVELSGDFNAWQPVRLNRELDGSWTVSLPLKPGTYRMNLRVDGERWLPPPGTTAVDDEFNGKVGLVIVR